MHDFVKKKKKKKNLFTRIYEKVCVNVRHVGFAYKSIHTFRSDKINGGQNNSATMGV